MLQRALGSVVVPVVADSGPPDRSVSPPSPDVGLRWGRPAAFDYSPSGRSQNETEQLGDGFPHITAKIVGGDEVDRRLDIEGQVDVEYDTFIGVTETIAPPPNWAGVYSRVYWQHPTEVVVEFQHNLPKKYLGQLGQSVRYYQYTMQDCSEIVPLP